MWQLAAQVLDDLDDEDIGFGVVDEKKDMAVAKKLGKLASQRPFWWEHGLIVNVLWDPTKRSSWVQISSLNQTPTLFPCPLLVLSLNMAN